jgi:hypothetical protein
MGWGHLHLLPQDMVRLGQLYLGDGVWEGRRLLPEGWVAEATRRHVSAAPMGDGYGYLWWVPAAGGYQALGLGGQSVLVRPDLDLVVVTNGSGRAGNGAMVLPAVRSSVSLPANPRAWQKLQTLSRQLASPPAPGPVAALPAIAAAISSQTYALQPNVLGWKEMGLRFRQGAAEAHLVFDGHELPVGLDGVPRTPVDPGSGWPVALHGRWQSEDTFVLVYDRISQYRAYRLALCFRNATLSAKALDCCGNNETVFSGSVRK